MSRECSFQECMRPHYARNLCRGHYQQAAKGWDLKPLTKRSLSAEERFWQKVDKGGPTECWLWTGTKREKGHGQVRQLGRTLTAHRISYEMANGPIPEGLVIDHKCYVPSCVNPAHLQAVTVGQNNENLTGARSNSKSGIRGVCWDKKQRRWQATVRAGGVQHHVGRFDDIAEAEAAVIAKRNELHTNNLLDRRAS